MGKIINVDSLYKKSRFIIVDFMAKDGKNFMVADLPDRKGKVKPKALFKNSFTSSEELQELLKKAEQYEPKGFIVSMGDLTDMKRIEEPFTMDKHFDLFTECLNNVNELVIKRRIENELDKLDIEIKAVDPEEIFIKLSKIVNTFFPEMRGIAESMQPVTDREFIDLSLEVYKMLYSYAHGIDYKSEKEKTFNKIWNKPFITLLTEYKFDHFGEEIFKEKGLEIIERLENGTVKLKDLNPEGHKEETAPDILN